MSYWLPILATAIREEKKKKDTQIGKEVKLALLTDDMILYIENHPSPPALNLSQHQSLFK